MTRSVIYFITALGFISILKESRCNRYPISSAKHCDINSLFPTFVFQSNCYSSLRAKGGLCPAVRIFAVKCRLFDMLTKSKKLKPNAGLLNVLKLT